ncbi:MAG TPA: hypothetical protein VLG10_18325 [Methylomirabilota bacterium]|nr:hypothetical protein [Methylomirabilota bacterium]
MAKLPDPTAALSVEARTVNEKIARKRGRLSGPYARLMHHPARAERVADTPCRMGSARRSESVYNPRQSPPGRGWR